MNVIAHYDHEKAAMGPGTSVPAPRSWPSRAMGERGMMPRKENGGFTLIEAILSMTVLAIMSGAITGLYATGLQSLDVQRNHVLIDSMLRSIMETSLGTDFDTLASASPPVVIDGETYTATITVVAVDLDGDATPEATAKLVSVTIDGRSLSAILVDSEDKLGKI